MNDNKMYFYENFADEFDLKMNMYDLNKRIQVVFNELLWENIEGKKLLDAGCGTGWFSKRASEKHAIVTAMDLGENLLEHVTKKCDCYTRVGSILNIPFPSDEFDIIISSEVIEHVPDPKAAIKELNRVLKKGGLLILTTPNALWHFSVVVANKLNLRPYQGYENWLGWFEIQREFKKSGFTIEKKVGIHLFPFVSPIVYRILDFFHKFNKPLAPFMVNMAYRCKKI